MSGEAPFFSLTLVFNMYFRSVKLYMYIPLPNAVPMLNSSPFSANMHFPTLKTMAHSALLAVGYFPPIAFSTKAKSAQ
jgi:hypothetical protein